MTARTYSYDALSRIAGANKSGGTNLGYAMPQPGLAWADLRR
jgi:hypothetical protein